MLKLVLRLLLFLALILLAVLIVCAPRTLPIYQLAPPDVSAGTIPGPARPFVGSGATVSETADRLYYRSGPIRLEVYKASGGFWLEDTTKLWDPDAPHQLRDTTDLLPGVAGLAKGFANDSGFTTFRFNGFLPTVVRRRDSAGVTSNFNLDWRAGFGALVAGGRPRPWAQARKYPVTGGGGKFNYHYGDQGRVIGVHGVWREIQGVARRERLVPLKAANNRFLNLVGGGQNVTFRPPVIAYNSAPAPFAQDLLSPVYIYSGTMTVDGKPVPLRVTTIPATEGKTAFSPRAALRMALRALTISATDAQAQATRRTQADTPRTGSEDPEGPEEGGNAPPASAPWREAAASCLTDLPNMQANASEFLDALSDDGWAVNFNWVDHDAWRTDWMGERAKWADSADLLYYNGHASDYGWKLAKPASDNYLMLTNVDAAASPYGAKDLEWIAISACGPLQDESLSPGGGDALDRWWRAFDGLHLLLGYGSASTDVPGEGNRFAKYLLEGETIVNAWFRTAAELQPADNGNSAPDGPTTRAGAMWALKYGKPNPLDDHLWGHGLVAPDPNPPDEWWIMWSPP